MDGPEYEPYFTPGRALSAVALAVVLFVAVLVVGEIGVRVLATTVVALPVLAVVGVAAWFAVSWWISRRRTLRSRERLEKGLCESCGYDLRSGGDKCPECGALIWRPRDPLTGKALGASPAPGASSPTMRDGE
jgi:predicted RNA-binding Zn-ribbon protein involved in translation (DUF1610 family)